MADTVLVRRKFINRMAEQELFEGLVDSRSAARLLLIQDRAGRGKSALMKQLQYRCKRIRRPPVPVSLVALNELEEKREFVVVNKIAADLTKEGLAFPKFAEAVHDLGRAVQARREHEMMALLQGLGSSLKGRVEAQGAEVHSGANVVGILVKDNVFSFGDQAPERETVEATDRCVEAFLEDLRELRGGTSIVMLFDAYESSGETLHDWMVEFLSRHIADEARRLENLVIVIAGMMVPGDELRDMLGNRFEELVESRDSLSPWDREHVKEFLEAHGVTVYHDIDVTNIWHKLQSDWTIEMAMRYVDAFVRKQAR